MGERYRIVKDAYLGYEVQVWRWWWPFWMQAGGTNTHRTLEGAERYAEANVRRVIKYLGKYDPEVDGKWKG